MKHNEPASEKRRFLRFSIRGLLLLVAVLSVLLAIVAPKIQLANKARRNEKLFLLPAAINDDLLRAIGGGDEALARTALEAGARPDLRLVPSGLSILRVCIDNGQISMMKVLLEFGADFESNERLDRAAVGSGPPIYAAICSQHPTEVRLEMIQILIQQGADPQASVSNRDAMALAVYHADGEVADFLREQGLEYGPREMAALNRLDELRALVEENPAILHERFKPVYAASPGQGPTLLGMALSKGYREMALFLIEQGAPLDKREGLGQTALHLAARGGDAKLVRLLVARGADVAATDKYEDTPLTDCVWKAPPKVISALIESGANVNAQGLNGVTALHLAVSYNRIKVVRLLLQAGADPLLTDKKGGTALDIAQTKNSKIAELLIESQQ